jgi:hypothetical protein
MCNSDEEMTDIGNQISAVLVLILPVQLKVGHCRTAGKKPPVETRSPHFRCSHLEFGIKPLQERASTPN